MVSNRQKPQGKEICSTNQEDCEELFHCDYPFCSSPISFNSSYITIDSALVDRIQEIMFMQFQHHRL